MAFAPLPVAVLVATPIWRRNEMILGNVAGAAVIFGTGLVLILREHAALDMVVQGCLDRGVTCWPELAAACAGVAPCPTGEARITPGFRLPSRYVIHAVGPVWHGGAAGEAELLASAYRSSLGLAREHGIESVAFPAISTGVYGYP